MRVESQRIAGFGTSVFTEMSRLAVEHQAINLGQGFPDFAGPDFVKVAAELAIRADMNQYAPSHGTPRLRYAIAADWFRRYGRDVDADREVTVTTGATEAIFVGMLAFLDPGDEVIFFEPFYDAYVADAAMAGATPRVVRLHPPDWRFDPDELRAAFNQHTRVFLLNTPHNPTGKVFSRGELQVIADLCAEHDTLVMTDEVYDRIVFDGREHVPISTLPGMWERTLTINSTGKTFSMTGWKIGFAVGPAELNAGIRSTHQFSTFATATPFQEAMAVALESAHENGYFELLRTEYTARRDRLREVLIEAELPPLECQGAYFLASDITALGFTNDVDFCRYLVTEVGVAAIPPSAFYLDPSTAPPLARFCFAKRDETIEAAAERFAAMRR
ncbi:MAG TPA: methionine aminotransferase [Thermomicrobiales bacterium]|nr:methionine aminotransferase [Thermomicrobiales bacterium]